MSNPELYHSRTLSFTLTHSGYFLSFSRSSPYLLTALSLFYFSYVVSLHMQPRTF